MRICAKYREICLMQGDYLLCLTQKIKFDCFLYSVVFSLINVDSNFCNNIYGNAELLSLETSILKMILNAKPIEINYSYILLPDHFSFSSLYFRLHCIAIALLNVTKYNSADHPV